MKFFALTSFLCAITAALASPTTTTTVSVSYDQTYDNAAGSLDTVACSDGPNGMLTKGYTTFGSLPGFSNIGGAAVVGGWDSAECGTCWQLTYNGNTINVLAIDSTLTGFNIALGAMNRLTNNEGVFLGRINAQAQQVAGTACGLPA
ncbi:hypothetical protein PHLCEN_2v7746 [Hermanssonia centrifuga]|uniref:Cerato-platanin n=1 Tax=Hermanssonia centrifuga TaxID=98765 RepID=A0A2R6NVE3_9APHY|nr:hypothetical protein PHLCEN_2v7746 [Hermanssonia centrifuga]